MELVLVAAASLLVSGLTLYSGFGLGTLLMPIFALFFPVEVAVAATAVVHGANNILKIAVVCKHADRSLILGFGVPAIIAAFAGVMIGRRFLHRITMKTVQTLTGFLLLGIALARGAGLV